MYSNGMAELVILKELTINPLSGAIFLEGPFNVTLSIKL